MIDQIGNSIDLESLPQRIICLVPSITELLADLGLADKVVGRTKFCIFPKDGFSNAKIIGGTKNVHLDKARALRPDLIIANKEENVKQQVLDCMEFCPVYTSQIKTISDAERMIQDLIELTGAKTKGNKLLTTFDAEVKSIPSNHKLKFKVVYLIWKDPYMSIGADTFIHNMLTTIGFSNVYLKKERYPVVSLEEITNQKPDLILLSSEPYPFSKTDLEEIEASTGIKAMLIDGSYCSWYGSRIIPGLRYLKTFVQEISKNMDS